MGERKMNEKQLEFNREVQVQPSLKKDPEHRERHNIFDIIYRELETRKKQEAHLLYYESELLYLLVDQFKTPYDNASSKYKFYDLRRYPRKRYHMILVDHPICRDRLSPSLKTMGLLQPSNVASASFTSLIKRLEGKGWIKRIKDGKKLYLRITEQGMKKIKSHYEYHTCGII